jgi:hypothetical protein
MKYSSCAILRHNFHACSAVSATDEAPHGWQSINVLPYFTAQKISDAETISASVNVILLNIVNMRYGRTPERFDNKFDRMRAAMIPIIAVSALLNFFIRRTSTGSNSSSERL